MKTTTLTKRRRLRTAFSVMLLLLCIPCGLPAQQVLKSEQNTPRAGDEIIRHGVFLPDTGQLGEDVTWDFSRVQPSGGKSPVVYFNRNGRLCASEGRGLFSYSLSGDSMALVVQENAASIVRYHTPQLLFKFPLKYASHTKAPVSGKGKCYDRMEVDVKGDVESLADGQGRIILPGGDTLDHVIRVRISKKLTERYAPLPVDFNINLPEHFSEEATLDSAFVETENYLWYAQGFRYPVAEAVEILTHRPGKAVEKEQAAYLFFPSEQLAQLGKDSTNEELLAKKETLKAARETALPEIQVIRDIRVYPNPVKDHLEVNVSLSQPSDVQCSLYNMIGNQVYQSAKYSDVGTVTEAVDMSALPKGVYMIRVQAGGQQMVKKIVKQ